MAQTKRIVIKWGRARALCVSHPYLLQYSQHNKVALYRSKVLALCRHLIAVIPVFAIVDCLLVCVC